MPDDDDRPRDASSAADPAWSDAAHASAGRLDAVAPDDISELADDIAAYHREQRSLRRREFIQRHATSRGGRPVLLVLAALAVVAIFAGFLTVFAPSANRPSTAPLAKPATVAGQQGGLLPNVSLKDLSGKPVSYNSLRPAVIVLIPAPYTNTALLGGLAKSAAAAQLRMIVIAPTTRDASATALGGQIDNGETQVYYDANGQLATDVNATGVTVVLVNRDGIIYRVLRNVDADAQATSEVGLLAQQMLRTGG